MHFVRRIIHGGFGAILVIAAACTGEPPEQKAVAMPMILKPDIVATNAFYYYHDVDAAWGFYRDTLGLETVIDYGFAKIMRLADASYVTLVEAAEGMHSADEPKNVTLHLVTDQLNRWHTWFLQSGVHIEYGGDGAQNAWQNSFVVRDTEGYRLRFVRYNPHPNQDSFVDAYAYAPPVSSSVNTTDDMNIRATAFSVYYDDVEKVRPFFEGLFDVESIGLLDGSPLYQLAGSGFLSLEESAAPDLPATGKNSVTLSFFTNDVDAWFARASTWPELELRTSEVVDESERVRVFVGYDPTGVFLEWDTFLDLPDNRALFDYLKVSDVY